MTTSLTAHIVLAQAVNNIGIGAETWNQASKMMLNARILPEDARKPWTQTVSTAQAESAEQAAETGIEGMRERLQIIAAADGRQSRFVISTQQYASLSCFVGLL